MCRVLKVHFSGFYAWLHSPESPRAKANRRLVGLIKQAWLESGGVYGYRNITLDLKDLGERCSKNEELAKPFRWHKSADAIMTSAARAKLSLIDNKRAN
ncbi:MAG: hypothetical protein CL549_11090 [Alcanivorax sp.]|nr:hypothetical protein A3Q32_19890 [Alcanivorax sp. KX64203]MAO61014.1 hypothetical protein [Alcanivorax sp.]MAY11021.1 hypothetical protein [Alcanivorax sp.]MBI54100.1 hypothetical protein [Alcanivorax sp.]PHS67243.1 MAG: hypothetical protein COB00_09170 [Alcanivorax sp.]